MLRRRKTRFLLCEQQKKQAGVFWHGPLGLESLVANKVETQNKKPFHAAEALMTVSISIDSPASKPGRGRLPLAEVLTQSPLFYLVNYFHETHRVLVSSRLPPFCETSLQTQTKQTIALGKKPSKKPW